MMRSKICYIGFLLVLIIVKNILDGLIQLTPLYNDIDVWPNIYSIPIFDLNSDDMFSIGIMNLTERGKYKNKDFSTLQKGNCDRKEKKCHRISSVNLKFYLWKNTTFRNNKTFFDSSYYQYLNLLNLSSFFYRRMSIYFKAMWFTRHNE